MIPTKFLSTGETPLTNYDYTDIADGTGYRIFKLYTEQLSGSTLYKMTTNQIYSYDIETGAASTTVFTKIIEKSFDITFVKPQNVRGNIIFNIVTGAVGGGSPETFLILYAYHYDGSTETLMGSVTTPTVTAADDPKVSNCSASVSLRHFKKNEILRIKVQVYAKSSPASTHYLFHDPINRDSTVAGFTVGTDIDMTSSQVHIPFLLDL